MLIQFNSNYTPTGLLSFNDAKRLLDASDNGDSTLLLADANSMLAAPDFEEFCKKNDVANFKIGVNLVVESAGGRSTLTCVARGNEGLAQISRILSTIDGNMSSPSNHAFKLDELEGKLTEVDILLDEQSPDLKVFYKAGAKEASKVRDQRYSLGANSVSYKQLSISDSALKDNPELSSCVDRVSKLDAKYCVPTIAASIQSASQIKLAELRYNKTCDPSSFSLFFSDKTCVENQSLSHESNMTPFEGADVVSYDKAEFVPNLGNGYDFVSKSWEQFETNFPEGHSNRDKYLARLEEELTIISDMGYSNYFNVVSGFGEFCRERGVPLTLRGSAASSLVLHLNGLTPPEIDPVELNLDLRRFIGYHRKDNQADIDIEIPFEHRQLFKEYIETQQPDFKVASISVLEKFSKFKSTLEFVSSLHMPEQNTKQFISNVFYALKDKGVVGSWSDFKKVAIRDVPSDLMEGNYRFGAEHKACLVDTKLLDGSGSLLKNHPSKQVLVREEEAPFQLVSKDGNLVAHISKDNCERLGYTPFDILSSQILSSLNKTLSFIKERNLPPIDISGAFEQGNPYWEKLFGELLENYNVITQLSSDYASGLLKEEQPKNFRDLCRLMALIRPAVDEDEDEDEEDDTVDYGESLKSEADPLHTDLDVIRILERTKGEFIYDEQILEIATDVGALSNLQGDQLRTAIRKNKPEIIEKLRQPFIDGAVANGRNPDFAAKLYDRVGGYMGKYFFNESHAMSYVAIALQQMVIKDKYPSLGFQHFILERSVAQKNPERYKLGFASLTAKQEFVAHGVKEMVDRGFQFYTADVNKSKASVFWTYPLEPKTILPSLMSTGIDNEFLTGLAKSRAQAGGEFTSVQQICDMVNHQLKAVDGCFGLVKDNVCQLIKKGALDRLMLFSGCDLEGVEDTVIRRSIMVKFVSDYQDSCENGIGEELSINLTEDDLIQKMDLAKEELVSYGYSSLIRFEETAEKPKLANDASMAPSAPKVTVRASSSPIP